MNTFHPWGSIDWLVNSLEERYWSVLGCVSPEERCLSVLEYLKEKKSIVSNNYLQINDPPSTYSQIIRRLVIERVSHYDEIIQVRHRNIVQTNLMSPTSDIVNIFNDFIKISGANVILDITSLPKRFFFPFIKLLIKSNNINNLIVTYTTAMSYDTGDLADDPEPWDHLPLFGPVDFPEKKPKNAIVGIGFIPFGLSKLLKGRYQDTPVTFIFPFPPGPPYFHRSWEFLRLIEKSYALKEKDKIIRINSLNTSDTFNHLVALTNNGSDCIILAPYGPKPISLAFSIFATLTESPVYYTQPKKYNPFYCSGSSLIYGYLIKSNNKLFYTV
jgi:hypothetical protein